MNVGVVGSRSTRNESEIHRILDVLLSKLNDITVVSGGASGVDSIAEKWADNNGHNKLIYIPEWYVHGKSAGIKRNQQIVTSSDVVIAFWDYKSSGTKDTIQKSIAAGKTIIIIDTRRI